MKLLCESLRDLRATDLAEAVAIGVFIGLFVATVILVAAIIVGRLPA
jgi:hypothetical protein